MLPYALNQLLPTEEEAEEEEAAEEVVAFRRFTVLSRTSAALSRAAGKKKAGLRDRLRLFRGRPCPPPRPRLRVTAPASCANISNEHPTINIIISNRLNTPRIIANNNNNGKGRYSSSSGDLRSPISCRIHHFSRPLNFTSTNDSANCRPRDPALAPPPFPPRN